MVYTVTEGEEEPLKYPVMFPACELVVVNKIDLLAHLDHDLDRFLANLRKVNATARVIQLSARTGQGLARWCDWLLSKPEHAASPRAKPTPTPHDHNRGGDPHGHTRTHACVAGGEDDQAHIHDA